MFPLPQISNTNIREAATVKKIETTGLSSYVLYSDGSLYSTGDNTNGQLADGTTASDYKTWRLCSTGVFDIFTASDYDCTLLVVLKGYVLYIAGNPRSIYGGGSANITTLTEWLDISQYLDDSASYLSDIKMHYNCCVILIKNPNTYDKIYTCGSYRLLGNGGTTNNYTGVPVLCTSAPQNISKIQLADPWTAMILTTSNELYITGGFNNSTMNGSLGFLTSYRSTLNNVYAVDGGGQNFVCLMSDGLYHRGYKSPFGSGYTSTLTKMLDITTQDSSALNEIRIFGNQSKFVVYIPDNVTTAVGSSAGLYLADNTTNNWFKLLDAGNNISKIASGTYTLIYEKDGTFWCTGTSDYLPPNTGTGTIRQVQLPKGDLNVP